MSGEEDIRILRANVEELLAASERFLHQLAERITEHEKCNTIQRDPDALLPYPSYDPRAATLHNLAEQAKAYGPILDWISTTTRILETGTLECPEIQTLLEHLNKAVPQDFSYTTSPQVISHYVDLTRRCLRKTINALTPTRAAESAKERLKAEREQRRRAVVMPILTTKGWTQSRLATEAGVAKNSVNEYLDGTRTTITSENRKAIAEALGITIEQLPT